MAYSDYGAFVFKNGERRRDKEDVAVFASDDETFGQSSENIPSGLRIWVSLCQEKKEGRERTYYTHIHHGIMGDGAVRVVCHKQGLPKICELLENGEVKDIEYYSDDVDYFDYSKFNFAYKGYEFHFESGNPYVAEMVEPDGTKWRCEYDYLYGAGFEDG